LLLQLLHRVRHHPAASGLTTVSSLALRGVDSRHPDRKRTPGTNNVKLIRLLLSLYLRWVTRGPSDRPLRFATRNPTEDSPSKAEANLQRKHCTVQWPAYMTCKHLSKRIGHGLLYTIDMVQPF
jgi:hypothetical protein